MKIPPQSAPQWVDIVTGKRIYNLNFLAAKILLGRLVMTVKDNPSQENIEDAVELLHQLYTYNCKTPTVSQDIKTIFGQG